MGKKEYSRQTESLLENTFKSRDFENIEVFQDDGGLVAGNEARKQVGGWQMIEGTCVTRYEFGYRTERFKWSSEMVRFMFQKKYPPKE